MYYAPSFHPSVSHDRISQGLRPFFRERVQKVFALARIDSTRLGAARRRVEPKKVYRKMAARIYVIRGRRLFPSFLHLLYTATTAASAARWVVQRRGAGTTQLPRKLLHNKTACTFSYSGLTLSPLSFFLSFLCSPHLHLGDATIATDLRSLSFNLLFSVRMPLFHFFPSSSTPPPHSLSLFLSLSLYHSYSIFSYLSSPFAVREEKVLVRYTCASAAGQIVKKREKRRFRTREGSSSSSSSSSNKENGVSFLYAFSGYAVAPQKAACR